MNYVKASDKDAKTIFEIVQSSVKNVYPKYYPQEVVNFFVNYIAWNIFPKI